MADSLNIPVFSGQGTEASTSQDAQDYALRSSTSPSGSSLLSSCFEAFHSDLASLSRDELEMMDVNLSDFDHPSTLLATPRDEYVHNPVISGPRLLAMQVLTYLEWVTRASGTATFSAPLERNRRLRVGVLGFSSGIVAACVIGTSATLVDFIFNATSAFRVTLWIGVRTQLYRHHSLNAQGLQANDTASWSRVLLGMERSIAEAAISHFSSPDSASTSLHVTAIMDDCCVTISGHPDVLDSFTATLPKTVSVREVPVRTLYHSPSYNEGVRGQVLADLRHHGIQFPNFANIICPIRSTFTGEALESNQEGSLLQIVVDMILTQPVNWDSVVTSVAQLIPRDMDTHLINVGPGTSLVRSIEKRISNGSVISQDVMSGYGGSDALQTQHQEPIAIIGMAVNMPGASDTSELWHVLEQGIDMLSEIPGNRFHVNDYESGESGRSMRAHTGNFLSDVDKFDHEFFKISPREARSMDPQIRILLQTAHEALEDSGYVPNAASSFNPETFGCYIGAATADYVQNLRNNIDVYYGTGNLRAFLSGRISFAMGFSGPSVSVDTACSSSLAAIHQACRALSNGDCDAALAGGVNVITSPDIFIGLDRGHFLSPTGQCKSFDASADGYSRGEGCGLFVLKRLSDARADNDRILGIIRGIEVNQSGMARSITQPHVPTQIKLLQRLVEKSGVDPHHVNLVEAHGTGTQSGDLSELASVRQVFATRRTADNLLHVTSIKANIGHLEAASGAAGLAKLLLMLRHHVIPRQISLVNLNPRIPELASDHTIIDTENQPWVPVKKSLPRMALLNNFGAAGSNSALLLEEYVASTRPKGTGSDAIPYVFGLSAKTETALDTLRSRVIEWLGNAESVDTPLCDIAYSMTARRQLYERRLALTARTRDELVQALRSSVSPTRIRKHDGRVAFVFSGQGGQYLGMGEALYESMPIFRDAIDQCHLYLVNSGFPGVLPIISPKQHISSLSMLEEIQAYQSAGFALEYGLAQLWVHWGLTPSLVVGHSLGEYVAQTVAGVLTLHDALTLVANRARLMVEKCRLDSTGMLAVQLSPIDIERILNSSETFSGITIAGYNSPEDSVLAGPSHVLRALKLHLDATVHCKNSLLPVPFGYHSEAMRHITADLDSLAERVTISPPAIPIISNVHGELVLPGDTSVFNAQYYSRHCVEPVLFDRGIRAATDYNALSNIGVWIEIGPHASILPMLKRHPTLRKDALLLSSIRRQQDPLSTTASALAQLYASPIAVRWRNIFSHLPPPSNVSLPTYPWSKVSFWMKFQEEAPPAYKTPTTPVPASRTSDLPYAVLRVRLRLQSPTGGSSTAYETPISQVAGLICGHRVGNQPLCPASLYHELALAGAEAAALQHRPNLDGVSIVLQDIRFSRPLVYAGADGTTRTIHTHVVFQSGTSGWWSVESAAGQGMVIHARGTLELQESPRLTRRFSVVYPVVSRRIISITSQTGSKIFTTTTVYDVFFPPVVTYAEGYRAIQTLTISADSTEGYATIQLPSNAERGRFVVHPVLMDVMLHVAGFIANTHRNDDDAFICSKITSLEALPQLIDHDAPYGVYVNCAWLPGGDMLAESYTLQHGSESRIVAHVKGMLFRKVALATLHHRLALAAGIEIPIDAFAHHSISAVGVNEDDALPSGLPTLSHSPLLSPGAQPGSMVNRFAPAQPGPSAGAQRSVQGMEQVASVPPPSNAPAGSGPRLPGESNSNETTASDRGPRPKLTIDTSKPDVKSLLAFVLGLEPHRLPEDVDLESLGLDSLASIEAHHALQSRFSLALPSDLFSTHTSAKEVESFVMSRLSTGPGGVVRSVLPSTSGTNDASAQQSRLATCPDTVPISVQKTELPGKVPLFLVHDGSGLVKYIHSLPTLGRDVWGIHNPHFISSQPWSSVTAMAAEYAKYTIKASHGSVLLGGWSFGGIIAFEVARQLLRAGITVNGVVLIDSPSPLMHVPLEDALIDSIVKLDGRNPVSSNTRLLVKRQFEMNSRLLHEYDPTAGGGPYPRLVLLRSQEGYRPNGGIGVPEWLANRDDRRAAADAWENIVDSPVKCVDIPGHHFQPFHGPYISSTTRAIIEACSFLES